MEAGLPQLLGHALGVLGQLGERHVAVDDLEAGGVELGLELAQPPQVGAQRHEGHVGLVAEHRPPAPPARSSASADFTAATTASPSASGPALQNRCSTPTPTVGASGSGMRARVPGPSAGRHLGAVEVGDRGLARGRTRRASCPARRAASTASADGALTATTALKPAAHAFCTISKPARPLM